MSFADLVYKNIVPFIDGTLIPLLYVAALLFFLFGVLRFFFSGGEENREKGKQFAIWGIIGFVVMFSVWSLVKLLLDFLPGGA
jgi:uncharacterized membrane protein YjfL (UPF0719 family)